MFDGPRVKIVLAHDLFRPLPPVLPFGEDLLSEDEEEHEGAAEAAVVGDVGEAEDAAIVVSS